MEEIMQTKEPAKLLTLQQNITLPTHLAGHWSESLWRILHESNSEKVYKLQLCNNVVFNLSFFFLCDASNNSNDARS